MRYNEKEGGNSEVAESARQITWRITYPLPWLIKPFVPSPFCEGVS